MSSLAVRTGYATNNCYFVKLECTSLLNANNIGVIQDTAKGVKEAGGSGCVWGGGGGTNKLAPKLFISFISIVPFCSLNIARFLFTLRNRLKISK